MKTTEAKKAAGLKVGDRVEVPGRFRNLTVAAIRGEWIRATFDSGFGWYAGRAEEFSKVEEGR